MESVETATPEIYGRYVSVAIKIFTKIYYILLSVLKLPFSIWTQNTHEDYN
jgi:hypothetical protein